MSALVEGAPTARARLRAAAETLQRAGIATARVDAEWLLAGVLDVGRFAGGLDGDRVLSPEAAARFEAAVLRRARREPLQRILGWEEFRGLRISLTDDALVPRPETEMLVQWALELLPPRRVGARPLAVDLGTGSGCIACALASEREDVSVVAVDLSPAAACVARDNAAALGLGARVHVVAGDLLAPLAAGRASLIVSNPPYLPSILPVDVEPEVSRWEPRLALDGGADGLATTRRIAATARARLGGAGALVLETAGESQVAAVAALLGAEGFRDVAIRADLAGVRRFVAGRA